MTRSYKTHFIPVFVGTIAGISMAGADGCGEGGGPLGDLAEQCGLVCSADGILEGNASISGIASIDAFFGAVIDVRGAAGGVLAAVRAELDAMALTLGLEEGAAAADISAAISAKISGAVDGGLSVMVAPAKCEASVEVAASAAAECDVDVQPGELPRCEGSCQIDASAQANCMASGMLRCEGTAPSLACSGTCTGSCQLETAASCEGTCRGMCMGMCTVQDASGQCSGKCDGMCQGSCELEAGGSCSGKCEGSCEYDPGTAMCEAGATAKCEGSAMANVECKGGCEGEVKPPRVKAECEATVEAKASASVECTPPRLEVTWQWSASLMGDANAQAEFRAWVKTFQGQLAALLAASAKVDVVLGAANLLVSAAGNAVTGAATELSGDLDLKTSIGAGCAIKELPKVSAALEGAVGDLEASASAVVMIKGAAGI